MHFHPCAALLAAWALTAAAAPKPVPHTHAIHEKRHGHDRARWQKRGRVAANIILPIRIGLKQSNLHRGYDLLMDISHPSSNKYGKHYTSEEVIELFKPEDDTVESVKAWLIGHGIHSHRIHQSDSKGWLAMDLTAAEAESLLHAEYHEYRHTDSGIKTTSCEEYHLPKHIQGLIEYITPGIKLYADHQRRRDMVKRTNGQANNPRIRSAMNMTNPSSTDKCDQAITPACIKALYQIPDATCDQDYNELGIFQEGFYYSQKDLDKFFTEFAPFIPNGTQPTPALIDGAAGPVRVDQARAEPDLDFQLAYPLVYPQKMTIYQVDDIPIANETINGTASGIFNSFLDAIDGTYCTYSAFGETGDDPALDPRYPDPQPNGYQGSRQCGVYKPTNVITSSYRGNEVDLPYYYQQRQCNEFMKLGLQGMSILFASGDYGVAGGRMGRTGLPASRTRPSTRACLTAALTLPSWAVQHCTRATKSPMSSPNPAPADPDGFSSAGGFSNIYSMPSYQQAAVAEFYAKHDPGHLYYSSLHNAMHNDSTPVGANGGRYNRIGRGFPDVAALSDNITGYRRSNLLYAEGTSAAAPIFASILTRINAERAAVGKSPVGFVNPALYASPAVLNDITNGMNPGCGTDGFSAVPGWDPVTGLGSPNYPRMLDYFLSFP